MTKKSEKSEASNSQQSQDAESASTSQDEKKTDETSAETSQDEKTVEDENTGVAAPASTQDAVPAATPDPSNTPSDPAIDPSLPQAQAYHEQVRLVCDTVDANGSPVQLENYCARPMLGDFLRAGWREDLNYHPPAATPSVRPAPRK